MHHLTSRIEQLQDAQRAELDRVLSEPKKIAANLANLRAQLAYVEQDSTRQQVKTVELEEQVETGDR